MHEEALRILMLLEANEGFEQRVESLKQAFVAGDPRFGKDFYPDLFRRPDDGQMEDEWEAADGEDLTEEDKEEEARAMAADLSRMLSKNVRVMQGDLDDIQEPGEKGWV